MKLMQQVHETLRRGHYSYRTQQGYAAWIERYLRFHRERGGRWSRPEELGGRGIVAFLSPPAGAEKVSE